MRSQILHGRQPGDLKEFEMSEGRFYMVGLENINFGTDAFTITLANDHQLLHIIYDQMDPAVPVTNYIWNFRYGTETTHSK